MFIFKLIWAEHTGNKCSAYIFIGYSQTETTVDVKLLPIPPSSGTKIEYFISTLGNFQESDINVNIKKRHEKHY